jgi:hypothetical protein
VYTLNLPHVALDLDILCRGLLDVLVFVFPAECKLREARILSALFIDVSQVLETVPGLCIFVE